MRTGAAARLAGLTPSTLRIWEHRYGVVAPPKSTTGQRTYSMKDVERLRLLKHLTQNGHAIGTVAQLDVQALGALLPNLQQPSAIAQRVLVVCQAAAQKLAGRLRPAPALVFDDLAHIEREVGRAGAADVLVIRVPTLPASVVERVKSLRLSLPVASVIVVYSFGAEAVAEALRAVGVTVRREPISGKDLAGLITESRSATSNIAMAGVSVAVNHRRFSDAELVTLTEIPSLVACECPRHLAEIVTLLVNFELYSTECAAKNEADSALHRHLHDVTSTARAMLEHAMARVVAEEGLVL